MSIVERYLRELREVFTYLSNDKGVNLFTHHSTIPWILLVFITAISSNYMVPLTSIIVSLVLLVAGYKGSRSLRLTIILKPLIIVLLVALVSSSPVLLNLVPGDIGKTYLFILRTVASTLLFIVGVQVIGWLNIVRGISIIGAPREVVESLLRTIKFIPLFINETLRMLMARSTRIIGERVGMRGLWYMLAGVVVDIVVKAHHRALMMDLAFTARSLGPHPPTSRKRMSGVGNVLGVYDYVVLVGLAIVLLVEVLGRI